MAWSVIGAPCLGAPAGADLATDSDASSTYWSGSSANTPSSNHNTSGGIAGRDVEHSESSTDWQRRENEQSCEVPSYQYRVKTEPIEAHEVMKQQPDRPDSVSSPPLTISPPPPSPSPVIISTSAPGGTCDPPSSDHEDGPPPPKNKKHRASQTSLTLPANQAIETSVEIELRLNSLKRAQERAEELHHEQLRESRARAEAAQAERDHRIQLIRHAEEIHQQTLEAQRLALEHSRQLHELTMRQAHTKPCE